MTLAHKNILLIIPRFYGYENLIKEQLESDGIAVTFIENKAFRNDPVTRNTKWYLRFLCKKKNYIRRYLIPTSRNRFDVCLFINLFSFHPEIIKNLRKQNPTIVCILYLWDNVKDYQWEQYFKYFDKIYSFDPIESKKFGLVYLPNFYPPAVSKNNTESPKFDFSFVGSLQIHRLKILDQLLLRLQQQNKSYFFYLYLHPNYNRLKYNELVYSVVKLFPSRFKGYKFLYMLITKRNKHVLVHHLPVTISESVHIMENSRCILDLPFPSQTGSTQRVIQALALNKKVITTNEAVVQESFYTPEYIKVVSAVDPLINWDWISQDFMIRLNINYLRLDNWLHQILELKLSDKP